MLVFQAFRLNKKYQFIHDIDKIRREVDIDQEHQGIAGAAPGHTEVHQENQEHLHTKVRNHQEEDQEEAQIHRGEDRRVAQTHQAGLEEESIHSQKEDQPGTQRDLERIHPGDLEGERTHRTHQAGRGAGHRALGVHKDPRFHQSR
jgi:hypothetical protein